MRHRLHTKKLSRTTNQRRSLIKNQIRSLLTNGSIKTTMAKAKAIKLLAEKYCQKALKADLTSRRFLYSLFQNRHTVINFEKSLTESFANHKSSFFNIIKLKNRQGDDALIVKLYFVKPFVYKQTEVKTKEDDKAKKSPKSKKIVKPSKQNDKTTK